MCVKRARIFSSLSHDANCSLSDKNTEDEIKKAQTDTDKILERSKKYFIGAHVSGAGGLFNAFHNCHQISGRSMALFLKNQRKWESPPIKDEEVNKFLDTKDSYNFDPCQILPHGSYLINLGNPDVEKRKKSYENFVDDLKRCEKLGIKLYNFHPGSTVGECTIKESIKYIAENINMAHETVKEVCIVLETMAGQGHTIGNRFEELRGIIDLVKDKGRIGVCIDTCHIFAAGYDIRSKKAYEKTMTAFSEIVGFEYLKGVHLNDSKTELGSGKDRHENIGKGKIGLNAFRHLVNDPRFQGIPMVLETPAPTDNDHQVYKQEIQLLYSLIDSEDKVDGNV